jgi:Ca2+-binding EF-hand superfamily protein
MRRVCLGLLLVALTALTAAQDVEETKRTIRMKTTRQLRELLAAVGVKFEESADKEALRELALKHNALSLYEALPENQQRQKPPGSSAGTTDMMFQALDKDKDGKISREEMQRTIDMVNQQAKAQGIQESHNMFDVSDLDKDGFLSLDEVQALFQKTGVGGGARKPGDARTSSSSAGQRQRRQQQQVSSSEMLFTHLDKDKDGRLSAEELAAMAAKANEQAEARGEAHFDFMGQLDSDSDGYIDKVEAAEFFKAMGLDGGGGVGGGAKKDEL